MNGVPLYVKLIRISTLSRMQYRANFMAGLLGLLFWNVTNLGLIGVLVTQFTNLKDWSLWELVFLYCLWIGGYSLYGLFFSHTSELEQYLIDGSFDQFLLRPASPFVQLLGRELRPVEMANALVGLTGLSIAYTQLDLHWDGWKWGFLIAAVLSGGLIVLAINLLVACTGFWTGRSRGTLFVVSQFYFLVQQYPIDIFGMGFRLIVTGVLPVAFMNYYPALFLLDKINYSSAAWPLSYLSPIAALLFLFLASVVWRLGLNQYASSGS